MKTNKKHYMLLPVLLLIFFIIISVQSSIRNDIDPGKVFSGTMYDMNGDWAVENSGDGMKFIYTSQIPHEEGSRKLLMLFRSHWNDYSISVDGQEICDTEGKRAGAQHLFPLPEGKTLTVQFNGVNAFAKNAIMRSQISLGDSDGIYSTIIKNNLYAGIYLVLTLFLGLFTMIMGIYMKPVWSKDICESLRYLGIYILCSGCWVLTDSQLLLLVTQKTECVEFISFIAFFSMPVPLVAFTKKLMQQKEKMLSTFEYLFLLMELLYAINYSVQLVSITVMIISEHVLMGATIIVVLYSGFTALRKNRNAMLFRVMLGNIVFSGFSILAFGFFYKGSTFGYSIYYMLGILGFIFFLIDAASREIYEQLKENANVAIYEQLAYRDMMTGLGNRSAFEKENEENANYKGNFAYIMVDANNLKMINDNQGHQKGDELLRKIAECIRKGVGSEGNCYRIGGDEFVVSLKGRTSGEADEIIKQIRDEIQTADMQSDIKISAAMGSAWTDEKKKDLVKLLKQADAAMYENKQQMKSGRTV